MPENDLPGRDTFVSEEIELTIGDGACFGVRGDWESGLPLCSGGRSHDPLLHRQDRVFTRTKLDCPRLDAVATDPIPNLADELRRERLDALACGKPFGMQCLVPAG